MDIEKIFKSEILEKKKHASSNRSKTGRGGSRSRRTGILPLDRMSAKERREYTKAGEVKVSFMYDKLIGREEFEKKEIEEQTKIMTRWRDLYTNTDIMKGLGISSNNTFYGLLKSLDVPQKRRGGFRGRKNNTVKKEKTMLPALTPIVHQEEVVQQLIINGLHLEYNGKYDAEQLEKIFTKLQLIVGGDDNKYRLSLSLTEIE